MTEVEGDVVQPLELIIPRKTTLGLSGEIILSGDKLYFGDSSAAAVLITSA